MKVEELEGHFDVLREQVEEMTIAIMQLAMDNNYDPSLFGAACFDVAKTVREKLVQEAIEMVGGEEKWKEIQASDNPHQAMLDATLEAGGLTADDLRDTPKEALMGLKGGGSIH